MVIVLTTYDKISYFENFPRCSDVIGDNNLQFFLNVELSSSSSSVDIVNLTVGVLLKGFMLRLWPAVLSIESDDVIDITTKKS